MYTRSYSKGEARTQLPPDYGGTALVIGAPPPPPKGVPEPAERSPRRPVVPCPDCIGAPEKPDDGGKPLPPPFGNGCPEGSRSGDSPSESGDCRGEPPHGGIFPASLFDPGHLKNDDLLLLGLIFLMLKEGEGREGCREMLLILAVLYMAGME